MDFFLIQLIMYLAATVGSRHARCFLVRDVPYGSSTSFKHARTHLNYVSRNNALGSSAISATEMATVFAYTSDADSMKAYEGALLLHCSPQCREVICDFISDPLQLCAIPKLPEIMQMFSTEHDISHALPYKACANILEFMKTYNEESLERIQSCCPEFFKLLSYLRTRYPKKVNFKRQDKTFVWDL